MKLVIFISAVIAVHICQGAGLISLVEQILFQALLLAAFVVSLAKRTSQ